MSNKARRDQSLEVLRICAAFGVVAYHAKVPWMEIPYAGLIIFIALSPYVDLYYCAERTRTTSSILKTFITPWLFWSILYGLINILNGKSFAPHGNTALEKTLTGTSMHLWFMPFMCMFLIVLNKIKKIFCHHIIYYGSLAIVVFTFYESQSWLKNIQVLGSPYAQWLHAMPALFIGTALGLSGIVRNGKIISSFILFPVIYFTILAKDLPGINPTYPIGLAIFMIMSSIKTRWGIGIFQPIADCSLGIYLTHMIWVGVFNKITGKGNWLSAILSFACSLLLTWLVRKYFPRIKYII